MSTLPVFGLAARQAQWLTVRQNAVASNIANANTPGYKARGVESFESVLSSGGSSLQVTHANHLRSGGASGSGAVPFDTERPVKLESELVEQTEVRQGYELNTSLVKAFNRMLLSVAKS